MHYALVAERSLDAFLLFPDPSGHLVLLEVVELVSAVLGSVPSASRLVGRVGPEIERRGLVVSCIDHGVLCWGWGEASY
jgi:hypothetical protein